MQAEAMMFNDEVRWEKWSELAAGCTLKTIRVKGEEQVEHNLGVFFLVSWNQQDVIQNNSKMQI